MVRDFGYTLDEVNWLGNVVNLVYLPASFLVPYLYGKLGTRVTVRPFPCHIFPLLISGLLVLHRRRAIHHLGMGTLSRDGENSIRWCVVHIRYCWTGAVKRYLFLQARTLNDAVVHRWHGGSYLPNCRT